MQQYANEDALYVLQAHLSLHTTLLTSQVRPCPASLGLIWKHRKHFFSHNNNNNKRNTFVLFHTQPTKCISFSLKCKDDRKKTHTCIEHAQRTAPEVWRLCYLLISHLWHSLMWCAPAKMDKFSDKNVINHVKVSRTAVNAKHFILHTSQGLYCTQLCCVVK